MKKLAHCFLQQNRRQVWQIRRSYLTSVHLTPWRQHVDRATSHVQRILETSLKFDPATHKMVVIHDKDSELCQILFHAYQNAVEGIPDCQPPSNIEFDANNVEDIKNAIGQLSKGDLVVLIQSGAFYLNEYRIRLELFERELKTIEHVHLGLMPPEQHGTYVETLAFDHSTTGSLARALKSKIESSQRFVVESGQDNLATLTYETPMELCKLNLGDYSEMKNVGGTYPVGEVFTEPKKLNAINGEFYCFGFPNIQRRVEIHDKPFKLVVNEGVVTDVSDAPDSFKEVFELIKASEGDVIIREFGLGLNRGTGKQNPLSDVTAFERQNGLHFSLGKKHTVYKKEGIKAKRTRYHIDVFVDVRRILMDDHIAYENGEFYIE